MPTNDERTETTEQTTEQTTTEQVATEQTTAETTKQAKPDIYRLCANVILARYHKYVECINGATVPVQEIYNHVSAVIDCLHTAYDASVAYAVLEFTVGALEKHTAREDRLIKQRNEVYELLKESDALTTKQAKFIEELQSLVGKYREELAASTKFVRDCHAAIKAGNNTIKFIKKNSLELPRDVRGNRIYPDSVLEHLGQVKDLRYTHDTWLVRGCLEPMTWYAAGVVTVTHDSHYAQLVRDHFDSDAETHGECDEESTDLSASAATSNPDDQASSNPDDQAPLPAIDEASMTFGRLSKLPTAVIPCGTGEVIYKCTKCGALFPMDEEYVSSDKSTYVLCPICGEESLPA